MNTLITMTIACMKMFSRNWMALIFSLFMPALILFIFGNIDFDRSSPMKLGVVTHSPSVITKAFMERLKSLPSLDISEGTLEAERAELSAGNRAAVIDVPNDLLAPGTGGPPELKVYVNQDKPIEAQMALAMINQIGEKATLMASGAAPLFTVKEQSEKVHNPRYIEFLLPGVIAMSIMQMSVFSVAFVFATYKERGILKRLLATPMRPMQFVAANIITRLTVSVMQATVFLLMGLVMFDVHVMGAYWLLAMCIILGALMFLGLGFTISGLAKNVEMVPVLSNVIVLPMMFMGNVFFSNAGMPAWLHALSSYMPITFLANALRGVMTSGAGLMEMKENVLGMLVWAVILITTATLTFRFQKADA